MSGRESHVDIVSTESERLSQYLHALPPDAWDQSSACQHWAVRDVVAHLIQGAEIYTASISRGLQGDTTPLPGLPPAGTVNADTNAAFFAPESVSARNHLDQLLTAFDTSTDALNRLLVGRNSTDWDTLCYHPAGLFPLSVFLDLRISELAMHGWDIRSRVEPSAHFSVESLSVCVGLIPPFIVWFFRPGAQRASPVRYRFVVTGVVPSEMDIVVEGETAHLESAGEAEAHVTCRCDTEAFVLLMYGRCTLENAITDGLIIGQGDPELLAAFDRWFRGA